MDAFADGGIPVSKVHYSKTRYFMIDGNGHVIKEDWLSSAFASILDETKNPSSTPLEAYGKKMF